MINDGQKSLNTGNRQEVVSPFTHSVTPSHKHPQMLEIRNVSINLIDHINHFDK